jgi:predicted ArsR family transcriptional regulator
MPRPLGTEVGPSFEGGSTFGTSWDADPPSTCVDTQSTLVSSVAPPQLVDEATIRSMDRVLSGIPVAIGGKPSKSRAGSRRDESLANPDGPEFFASAVSAATSMFGDQTRRRIYLFARSTPEGVTAAQAAEEFGVHPNVARHHLDKLNSGGYLDVELSGGSGKTGRPSKRYKSNGRPIDLEFPARRHDLIAMLLGRALELLPHDVAAAMAEEVGEHYGRELAEQMNPGDGHRSLQSALHSVADALTAHGFAARTQEHAEGPSIVSGACPFGDLSTQHPVICAVDRGIVRAMLATLHGEGEPALLGTRPTGAAECTSVIG